MAVTNLMLKRLPAFYKRVMLNQSGVPTHRMPKSVSDITNKLVELNEEDPAKMEGLYRIIFKGEHTTHVNKQPEDVQTTIKVARAELAASIKELSQETIVENATDALRQTISDATNDVVRTAKKAVMEAANNYRPITVRQGNKRRKIKGVFPEEFERMVQLASQRVNVMLVGPAGCGKTFIAEKIGEALGLRTADQSCSEGISESTFTGWLLPTGASGKFEYVPSPFIDFYENGGVFLLDEIDGADANLLTFLNKAIANDHFFLPQRHKKPKVVKHKDFVVVAAANTFGTGADAQYVGRNQLDAATLDRFRTGMIYMDYSAPVEEALVDSDVLEWGRGVRKKIKDHKLFRIMSTRCMLDLTKMKAAYDWGQTEWEESYFADWTDEERRLIA